MTATIKDVSELAGVATSTVSYVLSGKAEQMKISRQTQEKVIASARQLNYRANLIAKNLRRKNTRTIGIIFNDLFSSWANEVMAGLNDVLFPADYQPMLGITFFNNERERKIITAFLDSQVEGLIIQPLHASADFYRHLHQVSDIPITFVGDGIDGLPTKTFMLDAEAAGRTQIDHLYQLGHRRIALFTSDNVSVQSSQRVSAAIARIRELGLEFPSGYHKTTRNMNPEQDMVETVNLMRQENPPTAIAVINDAIAYRVMSALYRLKMTDIAVIGIGNLPESAYDMINLSTIEEPRDRMGRAAGEYAMAVISGEISKDHEPVLFRGQLLERRSTTDHTYQKPNHI